MKKWILCGLVLSAFTGCTKAPEGIQPIAGFELNRYLGIWYEITRLDHSFEKNLVEVTAEYRLRDDDGISVVNRGRNMRTGEWKEATGKAYFVASPDIGSLKVSFFGPFYGGYHIAKIDDDYGMALVVGPNLNYAWILARSPSPDIAACEEFFRAASRLGIPADQWIKVRNCR